MKEEIWIEKYRPRGLDEIIGQESVTSRLKSYAEHEKLPHLLFSGPPGVGKTAAAIALTRELFGERWHENFIELNASDERGIDTVRTKIKTFARLAPRGGADFKIIFLDESDSLTAVITPQRSSNRSSQDVRSSALSRSIMRTLARGWDGSQKKRVS
jgi:replication factor C small subunit